MLGETLFDKRQLQCSLTSQQREQCVTLLVIFIIIIDILKSIDLPSQQLLYRELKMQFVYKKLQMDTFKKGTEKFPDC